MTFLWKIDILSSIYDGANILDYHAICVPEVVREGECGLLRRKKTSLARDVNNEAFIW